MIATDRFNSSQVPLHLSNNDGLDFDDWKEWFKGYDLSKPLAIIHFTKYELEKLLKEYHPLRGDGYISEDQFEKNKKLFQEDNEYMVWLGTHQKSGTGITLNKASYMILIDCPWTAAVTKQIEDRIHRIGTKNNVFIYRLICNNTIDEVVQKAIERKEALSDFVIDDKATEQTLSILKDYILNL